MIPSRRTVLVCAAVAVGTVLAAGVPAQAGVAEVGEATVRLAARPDLVADVAQASQADGAPVDLWALTGAKNQRWAVQASLDGYYRFRSVNSGKCLNVRNAAVADGAPVIQWPCGTAPNELWKVVPKAIGYQFVNKNSGKCLNVQYGVGQGNPLIQYTCSAGGATNDVWLSVWEEPPAD
ncbi:RICIN domain-containing protein [Saccharothrix syringae]|uniref:Ricin B lectin domain-containing protein n=1 Tax=Saccharothrix syringae TaxID=103733 RepID=A0A5Q0H130_SACSY|nr:RICIN domain-containing protein [Saccharothrix syringae]QFZ19976.1 hypothetical protein EKG83_23400 [Saccharothrix syringae]